MRFGSFVFPVSHIPQNDGVVIDNTLREIELAEEIGMDSVWLTEHHRRSPCECNGGRIGVVIRS